ncbi:MAG TPA: hypothetical protein VNO79_06155, partial [Actinomycetota bacterium]|nr:hypothetical protein [Actinomycetota bacterium]
MTGPALIALAASLGLVAPTLAAVAIDRRTSPRLAAAVHLWALLALGASPAGLLACLAGPGVTAARACGALLDHPGRLAAWA